MLLEKHELLANTQKITRNTKLKSTDKQNGYKDEKCFCDRENFQNTDYWVVKGSETIQGEFGDNYHGLKE